MPPPGCLKAGMRPAVRLGAFLMGGWVAIQYSSNHPHRCSLASSRLFSWRTISHISKGHWANFSAATSCTFMFRVWLFPRDLINLCKTLGEEICR